MQCQCVRFSARHHRGVFTTELTSDEEMKRDLGEWRRINVQYWMNVIEWMYSYVINMKNKQKEWHPATKPLKKCRYLKKFTSEGTLRQVFYLSKAPFPLPPLTHCIRQYRILIHTGKGGELTREKVRGALLHKDGRKIPTWLIVSPVYKFY